MLPWIILIVVLLIIVVALISFYNGLVCRRNSIDTVLKQHFDLRTDLLETASQYAAHEASLWRPIERCFERDIRSVRELTSIIEELNMNTRISGAKHRPSSPPQRFPPHALPVHRREHPTISL